MKKRDNPFSPGAGTPPPELVGRGDTLEQAEILFVRVKKGRAEKSMFLTGLRGVGKTVLLNEIERISISEGYHPILIEASDDSNFFSLLAPKLRTLLFALDRFEGAKHKVRRAMAVLKGFVGTIKVTVDGIPVGLDIEPEMGTADSGNMELDLPELFSCIAEAAQDKGVGIAIIIDEIQYLSNQELSALIVSMHKMQQRQLPLVLVGAGLPILPGLVGDVRSYSERLFAFPDIGVLSREDSDKVLQKPMSEAGVEFEAESLNEIFKMSHGYPYFLQEWGYQVWNHATNTLPITPELVRVVSDTVVARLDKNFFRVRYDRLTPKEKEFLRAMADIKGDNKQRSEIASRIGVKIGDIGPHRASLLDKGMVYSPSHGNLAFTVPLFGEFMLRAMPILTID